jgi:hypothetical protein
MMKTMQQRSAGMKALSIAVLATAVSVTAYAPKLSAGHGAAWGIGGLLAGGMLTKAYDRNKEQRRQTVVYVPPPRAAAAPASTTMTIEQKLNELNKLAAGGYITPEEYKAKKQAILDAL